MSTESTAVILIPLDITSSMLAAGTSIPVVDAAAGEVAWASGSHPLGARVNHDNSIWEAVVANPGVAPGTDSAKWLRYGPSNRMAPFDNEMDSRATATGSMTYVLRPGFFTGVALLGMQADHLTVQVFDSPGGAVVDAYDADLYEQASGLFELLFMPLRQRTKHYLRNLPIFPDAEVRITLSANGGGKVSLGMVSVGYWDTLLGRGDFGGVEYGATAEVKSYSYIKRGEDGKPLKRVRRGSATNVSCTVVISAEEANRAMELLHQVQGRTVVFIACGLPRYDYLSGAGDISGSATPQSFSHAELKITIEGVVQ